MPERADDPKSPGPIITERGHYLEICFTAAKVYPAVLSQGREMVRYCQERRPDRLLIDMSPLQMRPSTLERYELGIIGAELATYVKRVAVVAQAEFIDPQKFGAQVAMNRGLAIDVFSDRAAALAWLTGP